MRRALRYDHDARERGELRHMEIVRHKSAMTSHAEVPIAAHAIRILLVDEYRSLREGLRALFSDLPDLCIVGDVGTLSDAVIAARQCAPDVVVLDLSTPANGLFAVRDITHACPGAAVVIFTRHREPVYVEQALNAGAGGYVLKQSSSQELVRAVRAAACGTRHLDPGLLEPEYAEYGGPKPGSLTRRERDVLHLGAIGRSNKEIAVALGIAVKTVEVHKSNGMRKSGLRDRGDLLRYAMGNGWLRDI